MQRINHDNWIMDLLATDEEPARRPDYDRISKKRAEERRIANEKHQAWLRSILK